MTKRLKDEKNKRMKAYKTEMLSGGVTEWLNDWDSLTEKSLAI